MRVSEVRQAARGAQVSHTVTHTEEWDEEYCDACGHPESFHGERRRVDLAGGAFYIAEGCMVLAGTRVLYGEPKNNPYPRCNCVEFK